MLINLLVNDQIQKIKNPGRCVTGRGYDCSCVRFQSPRPVDADHHHDRDDGQDEAGKKDKVV